MKRSILSPVHSKRLTLPLAAALTAFPILVLALTEAACGSDDAGAGNGKETTSDNPTHAGGSSAGGGGGSSSSNQGAGASKGGNAQGGSDSPGSPGSPGGSGGAKSTMEMPTQAPPDTVPPAHAVGTCEDKKPTQAPYEWSYQMKETPAKVEAGGEYLGCDRMPVATPPTKRNTFLRAWHSNVDKGTHHQVLFYDDAPLTKARTCSGDPTTPLFFPYLTNGVAGALDFAGTSAKNLVQLATGVGPYDWKLPDLYGIFLDSTGDGQWVTNHHYLNISSKDVTVGGAFEMHVIDSVPYPLGRIFAGAGKEAISVPAMSKGTTSGTLIVPFDVELVLVGSHMHEHGLSFEQFFYDGEKTWDQPFYTSETWDSPKMAMLAQPIYLKKGQGITYRCTYDNFESHELKHIPDGLEASKGYEMCSVWSYYSYPRGAGYTGRVPPLLQGDVPSDKATLDLTFDQAAQDGNSKAAKAACPSGG